MNRNRAESRECKLTLPYRPITTRVLILAMTVSATIASGCTSMRTITGVNAPAAPSSFGNIKPGDTVAVQMKDGRRDRFKVARIEGDVLVSSVGARYPRADLTELKQKHFSHAKTWVLIAGIVAFPVLFLFVPPTAY
jgi:uncharacterized lipoprotein YajG